MLADHFISFFAKSLINSITRSRNVRNDIKKYFEISLLA